MPTRNDRRVDRTKKALETALMELMGEKGYEETSIQDLVDRANVGRSTFYSHYADKDALLRHSIGELGEFLRSSGSTAYPEDCHGALRFSRPMLEHLAEMRTLSKGLFGQHNLTAVHVYIREMLLEVVTGSLSAAQKPIAIPQAALAEFVVATFLAVTSWWLLQEPERSAAEVDEIFRRLAGATLGA